MKTCADNANEVPFPIKHGVVVGYMRVARSLAPSRGPKFLEAMAFMGYLFSMGVEQGSSPQIKGLVAACRKKKPEARPRDPIPVHVVRTWEYKLVEITDKVTEGKGTVQGVVLGFMLW